MKVFHVVVEFDSTIPEVIADIRHIRQNIGVCGATDDLLKFLLQQLVEEDV